MIIDSHCHAWTHWPYQPPVPDPASRGTLDQLVFEMDQNGVDRAVIICAAIDHNPANTDDVVAAARRHGERIIPFADIDCRWSPTHQTPGGGQRLRAAAARWKLRGFTHYLHEDRDAAWLVGDDGLALFRVAVELGLIASLACSWRQMPIIRRLAREFPTLPILVHHLARVRAPTEIDDVLAAATEPNIHIKFSGFGYASAEGWNFPCADMHGLARAIHDRFGADRLCWGSDYPVSRRYMTYRQSLEIVRRHCGFIAPAEMPAVLGGTMARLLSGAA
ncbi:MAG: amidohydrolase [Alphaproteobacteria bacterium]|nr:amidohydrolase [Alphaproteobacteria bacterium]